ncbi:hypothetical protein FCH28_09610 [Streptomyces piniterrae]|uniref:Uncharacterized protein n=1 Tax=Streptomyces piniterrae TaxID=2571125 RepID=A0A4U0NMJ5_9ACTN|nr:hypothetical protein [Streptomyces piniterrae]TJZ55587.1 hypothetical protein FCH28_09610 [Streptomyces piniterrae]
MTTIKFDAKVLADVEKAIRPHAADLFNDLGHHVMAIVEIASVERTEQGPDEEKDDAVKVRVVGIEIAGDEFTEEKLRQQAQTMYRQRTAGGTLDSVAS